MSTGRVKTLVIAALVIINMFFLTFIVWGRVSDSVQNRRTLEDISGILGQNGVTVNADDMHSGPLLYEADILRDAGRERAIAAALLSDVTQSDPGGSISRFESRTGSAVFSGTGEFTIELEGDEYPSNGNAPGVAKRLLRAMDMQYMEIESAQGGAGENVTAMVTHNGAGIFNCRIDFLFENGVLRQVRGRCPTGIKYPADGSAQKTAPTAMMEFLSDVISGNITCSIVTDVRSGYNAQFEIFSGKLIPVWRIVTDNGTYYY